MTREDTSADTLETRLSRGTPVSLADPTAMLRLIIDSVPALVSYVDRDLKYQEVNAAYAQWFGGPITRFVGRSVREVIGETIWRAVAPYVKRALAGKQASFEMQISTPTAGRRWVHVTYTPDLSPDRKVRGFVILAHDIGAAKQAHQAVQDSEEHYRNLFESSREGIILIDLSGHITSCNPAFAQMLGYTREELLTVPYRQLTPSGSLIMDPGPVRDAILTRGYSDEYQKQYVRKDGSVVPVSIRVWLIKDNAGQPVGMWGLVRDITDQKKYEQSLREMNQELERRVNERTAEALARASQLQALAAELTQVEERERRRLAQILHDHLQQFLVGAKMRAALISRRAAADPALHRDLARLNELLQEAIQESRSLTAQLSPPILYDAGLGPALQWLARSVQESHHLDVMAIIDPAAEPNHLETRTFLFQAARELLLNVVKHSGSNVATVALRPGPDGTVELVVEDHGRGFSPSAGEKRSLGGFGLFSIRERLELLGGSSRIESKPGNGARVTLVIPSRAADEPSQAEASSETVQASTEAPAAPAAPVAPGSRIRVLIADDLQILREGLAALLRDHPDVELVGEACDGAEAIRLARALQPEVVVMDASMPGLNGIEATRILRAEFPEIQVIGLSMYSERDMANAMRQAGAIAYLSKDGPVERLTAEIRRVRSLRILPQPSPARNQSADQTTLAVIEDPGDSAREDRR